MTLKGLDELTNYLNAIRCLNLFAMMLTQSRHYLRLGRPFKEHVYLANPVHPDREPIVNRPKIIETEGVEIAVVP